MVDSVSRPSLVPGVFFALRRFRAQLFAIVFVTSLVACGGNVATVPLPASSTFSVTTATPYSFTPQPDQTPFPLPQGGGFSGGSFFPTALAPSQGTLTQTLQNFAPLSDGVTALSDA